MDNIFKILNNNKNHPIQTSSQKEIHSLEMYDKDVIYSANQPSFQQDMQSNEINLIKNNQHQQSQPQMKPSINPTIRIPFIEEVRNRPPHGKVPYPCKYYHSPHSCNLGDECNFWHDPDFDGKPHPWLKNQITANQSCRNKSSVENISKFNQKDKFNFGFNNQKIGKFANKEDTKHANIFAKDFNSAIKRKRIEKEINKMPNNGGVRNSNKNWKKEFCRYYYTPRLCRFGDSCKFLHGTFD